VERVWGLESSGSGISPVEGCCGEGNELRCIKEAESFRITKRL
jgi:hypothetical protein